MELKVWWKELSSVLGDELFARAYNVLESAWAGYTEDEVCVHVCLRMYMCASVCVHACVCVCMCVSAWPYVHV
jgi:hypothetical protein